MRILTQLCLLETNAFFQLKITIQYSHSIINSLTINCTNILWITMLISAQILINIQQRTSCCVIPDSKESQSPVSR